MTPINVSIPPNISKPTLPDIPNAKAIGIPKTRSTPNNNNGISIIIAIPHLLGLILIRLLIRLTLVLIGLLIVVNLRVSKYKTTNMATLRLPFQYDYYSTHLKLPLILDIQQLI